MVNTCLVACLAAGVCLSLPCESPPLPAQARLDWATDAWIHDAAGIVAGETVPHCDECDLWIACTIVEDVTKRNYYPWRLRPGRWHGWKEPGERHLAAIRDALEAGRRDVAPECAYLGSLSDYSSMWRFGLASEQQVFVVGNRHGAIVCIPPAPASPSVLQ